LIENKELELAWSFVNNTNRSIFLTGKAGTGKTTFLHRLKMNSLKRMVVVVIDEISMVRADLLDGIDRTLRRFRKRNKVFGGVQVLMIGDLQQLSPVIKEKEWELLKHIYKNGFFFSSQSFQECNAVTIELKHIYRQENPKFIEILNEIRNNALSEAGAMELNKRFIPDFTPKPDDGYISLTTHNNKAEATNKTELNKLKSKSLTYKANVYGKFPEYAYPNKEILELKVGAQVMFVKNDSSPDKRYFNGKIGKTYVALSRCKSLDGLVLKSKIHSSQIISDGNVITFNKNAEKNAPDEAVLEDSQKYFQLDLIAEIFDFYSFLYPLNRILDTYYKNRTVIEGSIENIFLPIKDVLTHFLKVANGFNAQLKQISEEDVDLPEQSVMIQDRFKKGIQYFDNETEIKILEPLKTFAFTTDNQAIGGEITKHLDSFEDLLSVKVLYFKNLNLGFSTERVLELRAKSVFMGKEKPKKLRKTIVEGTSNVVLFEKLRMLRNDIAQEKDLIHYQIFAQKTLYEMCETLPTNKAELLKVNGMGSTRVKKYGSAILKVINAYCEENDIETSPEVDVFEAQDTQSKTIEHYEALKAIIPKLKFENLSDLKHQIDEKYSYGELRLVLEDLKK